MTSARLQKLITILRRVHPEADAEDVADWLWLAAHIPPQASTEKETSPVSPRIEETSLTEGKSSREETDKPFQAEAEKPHELPALETETPAEQEPSAELYAPSSDSDAKTTSGMPFRTPGGRALPHPLEITRALHPLMRRIAVPGTRILDEEATVRQIADSGVWLPVFRAKQERWLELALVFDDSPSMRLWHRTLKELRNLLMQQGTFRDVRVWKLKTSGKDQSVSLHPETSIFLPSPSGRGAGGEGRHYKELINPARARLILVLSDCVSPAWQGAELIKWLDAWGREHPLSLVQLLPQDLWQQTRLRSARLLKVTTPEPACANHRLQTRRSALAWLKPDQPTGLPLPLTTLEPDFLADWARFIAGNGSVVLPAFALKPIPLTDTSTPTPIDEDKRYQAFRAAASPVAFKLACFLAASPLTLPVMRLVQAALVSESGQTHLAEFFLSGLIKRVNSDEEISDPDEIEYEFLSDGLRNRLLDAGLMTDAVRVFDEVSKYIEEHYGIRMDIRALLVEPDNAAITDLEGILSLKQFRVFATVTARVLRRLDKRYWALADRLEGKVPLPDFSSFRDSLAAGGFGPEMVSLEHTALEFEMGDERGESDENPVHSVNLSPFAVGKYPVTFEEYDTFCEATGREKPDNYSWGRDIAKLYNL